MQGGGSEEELFRLTADASGVIDALLKVSDALIVCGEDLVKFAEAAAASGGGLDLIQSQMTRTSAGLDLMQKQGMTTGEAMATLAGQERAAADAMAPLWFEIEHGVAATEALRSASVGMDAVFSDLDNRIGLYDESMLGAEQTTGLYTAAVGTAKNESLMLVEGLLEEAVAADAGTAAISGLVDRMAALLDVQAEGAMRGTADAEATYLLAERMGVLADAAGLAANRQDQLFQAELDFTTAADTAAAAVEHVTTATQAQTASIIGTVTELDILTKAFSGATLSISALIDEGYRLDAIHTALAVLSKDADAVAAAMALMSAQTDTFATSSRTSAEAMSLLDTEAKAAAEAMKVLWFEIDNGVRAAMAMSNALVGMDTQFAEAEGVVTGFDAALASVGIESNVAAAGLASAGTAAGSASIDIIDLADGVAGLINQYFLLVMVLQMAAQWLGQFIALGADSEHTLNIIQAATGATDAQMQSWKASISSLGEQFGFTLNTMATGLELVVRSSFQGADAITVLTRATMLAKATGSDLTSATNLLTLSLNSYGAGANQAEAYSIALYTAWKHSRLTLQEFAGALGPTIGDAKALGISFQDLVNAEALYSKSTGDSAIATREFQQFISGLNTFADQTPAQFAKMAGAFDTTKYAAMDFTAKLADLAKFSDGDVGQFTKLIGGLGNARTAIDNLNISDKQLETNAANLGVVFDPMIYDSQNAAGKLLYLMTIVGDSGPKFAKLTDGTKATNTALADIGIALDKAGQKAFDMSSKFDLAKFNSEDLAQKLHQMADFLGGPTSDAFIKAIGGVNNLQIALQIMNSEADKTKTKPITPKVNPEPAIANLKKIEQHTTAIGNMHPIIEPKVNTKPIDDLDKATHKTANDTKTDTAKMQSAWSTLANDVQNTFAPEIDAAINGITAVLNALSAHSIQNFALNFIAQWEVMKSQIGTKISQIEGMILGFIGWMGGMWTIANNAINTFVDNVIRIFIFLMDALIGQSIIPDMINRIVQAFITAGTSWASAIRQGITQAIQAVQNLVPTAIAAGLAIAQGIATGILNGIGAAVAAATQLASRVAAVLAHKSPPKEGPLSDDDKWGGRLVDSFAGGMMENMSHLQAASLQMAKAAGGGLAMDGGMSGSGLGNNNRIIDELRNIRSAISQQATIGHPTIQGMGQVNQSFGSINFNGPIHSPQQLYALFNRLAGLSFEDASRGATSGPAW